MEDLQKLKLKNASIDWSDLKREDFEGITFLTYRVLAKCQIGKELKEEIRLDKPRFLNQIEEINQRRMKISKSLTRISFSKTSAKKLSPLVNKTINLYNRSIDQVIEFNYREIGTID